MLKVIHLSEVKTKDLFEAKQYMLGDSKGDWFVVDINDEGEHLYLGRYEDKFSANEHVRAIEDDNKVTNEEVQRALDFSGVLDDNN